MHVHAEDSRHSYHACSGYAKSGVLLYSGHLASFFLLRLSRASLLFLPRPAQVASRRKDRTAQVRARECERDPSQIVGGISSSSTPRVHLVCSLVNQHACVRVNKKEERRALVHVCFHLDPPQSLRLAIHSLERLHFACVARLLVCTCVCVSPSSSRLESESKSQENEKPKTRRCRSTSTLRSARAARRL